MNSRSPGQVDPRSPASPILTLLRQLAVIDLEPQRHTDIRDLISRAGLHQENAQARWQELLEQAEKHGLSALLSRHLKTLGITTPAEIQQQLLALQVRHRRANAARIVAAEAIVDEFAERDIRSALLKGMALASLIYPAPGLRPMSDIDILVDPRRADDAQQCLKELGYHAQTRQSGYQFDHHHLPMASHRIDNVSIHVEVHHDALSGDVAQSITLDTLTEPLREFALGETHAHSLGHIDTLRHLCHHTFEPVPRIKLGAVADLYGYACSYIDEIDTERLDHDYPFVPNIFRLMHFVSPLPAALANWVSPPQSTAPAGVGQGYPPMTETLAGTGRPLERAANLFTAPAWWLHGFYNVKPEHSIAWTRSIRHPCQVMKWLGRRALAKWREKRSPAVPNQSPGKR